MTESNPTPDPKPGEGEQQEQTFTQAEVDRIVSDRLKREREATKTKYADYDDLKAKAEGAKTAEERIASLEQEIQKSKVEALRAKYAADVPERLRPLLTGVTDEELKAQRDLLVEGEAEREKNGNHVPSEGAHPNPAVDAKREWLRSTLQEG